MTSRLTSMAPVFMDRARFIFMSGPVSHESSHGLKSLVHSVFKEGYATCEDCSFTDFRLSEKDFEGDKKVVLVFPGARSCSEWTFTQDQMQSIKNNVVLNRLKLIGVCAGAYFLSKHSVYNASDKTIAKTRELGFFHGSCIGPVLPDNVFETGKMNIKLISILSEEDRRVQDVALNGGGYFCPEKGSDDYVVVGRFHERNLQSEGKDVAMICCHKVNEGERLTYSAFLSSCHLEEDTIPSIFSSSNDPLLRQSNQKLADPLNKSFRRDLFIRGLGHLGFN